MKLEGHRTRIKTCRCRNKARLACSREEEVAKLVEGDGHDTVCEVEGFLDSVTMVDVYVNVQQMNPILFERVHHSHWGPETNCPCYPPHNPCQWYCHS